MSLAMKETKNLNEVGNASEAGSKGGLGFLTSPSLSIATAWQEN